MDFVRTLGWLGLVSLVGCGNVEGDCRTRCETEARCGDTAGDEDVTFCVNACQSEVLVADDGPGCEGALSSFASCVESASCAGLGAGTECLSERADYDTRCRGFP